MSWTGRSTSVRSMPRPRRRRVLGSAPGRSYLDITFAPKGDRLASLDKSGEIRLWSLPWAARAAASRVLQGPKQLFNFLFAINGDGTLLAMPGIASYLHVWDLRDPPDAEPSSSSGLNVPDEVTSQPRGFDPSGRWLVESNGRTVAFWPIAGPSETRAAWYRNASCSIWTSVRYGRRAFPGFRRFSERCTRYGR